MYMFFYIENKYILCILIALFRREYITNSAALRLENFNAIHIEITGLEITYFNKKPYNLRFMSIANDTTFMIIPTLF